MTGIADLNRPAFAAATEALRATGLNVVNPHDIAPHIHDGDCPPSYAVSDLGHSNACHLRTCLAILIACDELYLLPGWETSRGANIEHDVAVAVGLSVSFAEGAE